MRVAARTSTASCSRWPTFRGPTSSTRPRSRRSRPTSGIVPVALDVPGLLDPDRPDGGADAMPWRWPPRIGAALIRVTAGPPGELPPETFARTVASTKALRLGGQGRQRDADRRARRRARSLADVAAVQNFTKYVDSAWLRYDVPAREPRARAAGRARPRAGRARRARSTRLRASALAARLAGPRRRRRRRSVRARAAPRSARCARSSDEDNDHRCRLSYPVKTCVQQVGAARALGKRHLEDATPIVSGADAPLVLTLVQHQSTCANIRSHCRHRIVSPPSRP